MNVVLNILALVGGGALTAGVVVLVVCIVDGIKARNGDPWDDL